MLSKNGYFFLAKKVLYLTSKASTAFVTMPTFFSFFFLQSQVSNQPKYKQEF